ncbi:DUF805 domain-containing protein [Afifella sp. IM 167]|uniref:DUF805 domain-containing protein n=1 Tax=Afifella sp. IM 167 TaxID=2033586 RepID=UPI001CCE0846|nr:DUF805 domain-containing protein [Afifella sp. IM 167]MBZ8133801.1 DUF805 domain-containing protein [Afifella sp. IM 167]
MDWKYLYTSFEGRIGRRDWWLGVIGLYVVWLISWILFGSDGLVPFVVGVLIFLGGIACHVKRFHDRGRSGWWSLIVLVPVIGPIWAVVDLGILEGEPESNRWGPPATSPFGS